MKKSKGLREQSREWVKHYDGSLSLKDLENYLMGIFNDVPKHREVVFGQWCRTQGFVQRSSHDLKLCNDPNCASCQALGAEVHKQLKALSDSL